MSLHDPWLLDSGVKSTNRSAWQHKVICRSLHIAATTDAVNLRGLASLEYLNRWWLLLEEAHREEADKPNFEGAHHYMGEDEGRQGAFLVDSLRQHVATEFSREAAIAKERRKATQA